MRPRSFLSCVAAGVVGLSAGTAVLVPATAQAADTDIRINEVSSNSAVGAPDFVELTNIGSAPVDVTGWILRDNDDTHGLVLPATTIQPGGFVVLHPDEGADGFGLGSNDSARLFTADGSSLVDSYSWTDHAFSEGRLPDGTGAFVDTEPTPGEPNVAREIAEYYDAVATVAVNEVQSDDPDGGQDWVELINTGSEPVDLSGWILRDNDDLSRLPIAAGTVLAPGAFLAIGTNVTDAGFGLGRQDQIRLFLADGLGLVDSYSWTDHAVAEGRVPDGDGAFVDTVPTRGSANVARGAGAVVVINEVESNGDPIGDWVELANTDQATTVDVTGWTLIDGDPTHDPIVLTGEIESGGYRAFLTEPAFGLGGADSVTLRNAAGVVVDSFAWTTHAATTYGRCPDMTGAFTETSESTYELVNACEDVTGPEIDATPWPFGNDVREGVAPGTWGEDMSGLDVAADGTVFAVNNDNGEIFSLAPAGDLYTIDRSWLPVYPNGAGEPDAEGISVAGDGAIFLSTERDNTASGVSRPSVLRVELGVGGSNTTTHEWNLTPITGPLGANAGLEGVEWISDADATRLGVRGADGNPYDPTTYGEHFGGIFAVAVEQTGSIHVVVLEANGGMTLLQTASASESVPVLMDLDWRAGGNELWGLCDEACENRSSVFAFDQGVLTLQVNHHAPTGMNPSFTNEGLTFLWCDVDPASAPTTLWISDTAHNGVSLRYALGDPCEAPVEPMEPTEPTEPTPPTSTPPTSTPPTSTPPTSAPESTSTSQSTSLSTSPSTSQSTSAPRPTPAGELTEATRGGLTGPATATPGQTVTLTLPGSAGRQVQVWLHSEPVLLGTVTASAQNTLAVTVPTDTVPGRHHFVMQDAAGAVIGWTEVLIVAATGISNPVLAATGAGSVGLSLGIGAAVVLLGGAMLLGARRVTR